MRDRVWVAGRIAQGNALMVGGIASHVKMPFLPTVAWVTVAFIGVVANFALSAHTYVTLTRRR